MKKYTVKLGPRGPNSHTIKLLSNSSTDYSWERRECYCSSIISDSHRYVQFSGPPGTGGEEIWTFTATGKGDEVVKLVYGLGEEIQDEREIHFFVK